jgi:ubiquinone/menaquinone biosynthesis C-methylase UbiE
VPPHEPIQSGSLRCDTGHDWAIEGGLPWMYERGGISAVDRVYRFLYDRFPWSHDVGVKLMFPLLEGGGSEHRWRNAYLDRMELEALQPAPDGGPVRILEVSSGTGANLPRIVERLPKGLPSEIWGLDFSEGMMGIARKRVGKLGLRSPNGAPIRFLMGDAHTLPFADGTFDRVFHVGGIASFGDPGKALREMIRVAKPGTPIVVVDEALDHTRRHTWWQRYNFFLLVPHERNPQPPREALPREAEVLFDEPISRFYYCWAFRVGGGRRATT